MNSFQKRCYLQKREGVFFQTTSSFCPSHYCLESTRSLRRLSNGSNLLFCLELLIFPFQRILELSTNLEFVLFSRTIISGLVLCNLL